MSWRDLLASQGEAYVLPWLGGRKVYRQGRTWNIEGKLPRQHGWYRFEVSGRQATLKEPADSDGSYEAGRPTMLGYLAGTRFISDQARVTPDPNQLIDQTENVYMVERGLDRFTRALVCRTEDDKLLYLRQEFPQGPELEVQMAYQDRKPSLDGIKGVTPALDLAFRWESLQRSQAEERERREAEEAAERERMAAFMLEEEAREKAEQERIERALKDAGTGAGRRALAQRDFKGAATAALAISGAELLDYREGRHKTEMVVQYKFMNRRLECVCDRYSLRILDAGVCLDDHHGTKGDTFFTLESLPAVIGEAIRERKLTVWRHVAGDPGARYDEPEGDEDD